MAVAMLKDSVADDTRGASRKDRSQISGSASCAAS